MYVQYLSSYLAKLFFLFVMHSLWVSIILAKLMHGNIYIFMENKHFFYSSSSSNLMTHSGYFFPIKSCQTSAADLYDRIRYCPASPEKEDQTRCRFPRRVDSAGPVSPTCIGCIRPKAGNALQPSITRPHNEGCVK